MSGHHHHDHTHSPAGGCGAPAAGPAPSLADVTFPHHQAEPVQALVTRGPMAESRHRVRVAVVDAGGHVVANWGDLDALVYPRSSNKCLQAVPLIESGAADAFQVTPEELALAVASHGGEVMHTQRVAAWLARLGLGVDDLECGAHLPTHEPTAHALLARGEAPTALHNNCSGKHTGFLTVARHKGEKTRGYVRWEHPVQQRILGVLEQVTGQDLSRAPWGVDGCAIPTIGLPLGALALGMARIADPSPLPDRRAEALARLAAAWGGHPELVAGTGTFDTGFMRAVSSRVLLKSGAEGVCCAVLKEQGLGVALKVEDGAPRAAGPVMAAVLRRLGVVDDAAWEASTSLHSPVITNRQGATVGAVAVA